MNSTSNWRSPSHGNLRSRRYDTAVLGPLTDSKIFSYMLAGYYGERLQRQAQIENELRKERKAQKKVSEKLVKDILSDPDLNIDI